MLTNGLTMREHWMLPILLAPNVLSQAPPPKVAVAQIEHFESLQVGPFQPLLHMSFGEPPQPITGIFDTGSSDIIVPKAGSAVCNLPSQQCRKAAVVLGDFDPSKSSDVQELKNETFNAGFGGGDNFDGSFIKTTTRLGEAKVEGVQVALAVNGSLPGDFPEFPIFGVGPPEAEQTDNKYATMVDTMKEKGVIESRTMGVVLNRIPFENGSVVFGGFDKGKFKGELQAVPLIPAKNGKIVDFVVNMTSIRLEMNDRPSEKGQKGEQRKKQGQKGQPTRRSRYGRVLPRAAHVRNRISSRHDDNEGNGGDGNNRSGTDSRNGKKKKTNNKNNNKNQTMDFRLKSSEKLTLFDSGGVVLSVPSDVAEAIAETLDTEIVDGEMGPINCNLISANNKLLFGFNDDKTILSVPFTHMQISESTIKAEDRAAGKCTLGIDVAIEKFNIMGFSWMSAVYTVFDLDNNRLMFAEAVENSTQSDIQAFTQKPTA